MKESRVVGGILLIGGSCIGAGMLGLPIMTGICGFFPSLVMFFLACLFMSLTGLLLVEVHGWYGKRDVHFLTMVSDYLGPFAKFICWIFYLFLFYAILVAYIAASGIHFSSFLSHTMGLQTKTWIASLVFVLLFGWITYLGTSKVDFLNRFLMLIKIAAFVVLIVLGVEYIQPKLILHTDVKYALFPLPLLIISFGFQNIIPTLVKYLDMDSSRVKKSILGGAIFILIVYLIWQFIVIGTVPVDGPNGIIQSYKKGVDGAEAMKRVLDYPLIGFFAQIMAFFAILTSFLAQGLTVVHFLADGLKVKSKGSKENPFLCLLAFIPPLVFALFDPTVFFKALNFAGGVCAIVIFGFFPTLMAYKGRYIMGKKGEYQLRGGKTLIILLFLFALFVFFYQLSQSLGFAFFPQISK